MIRENIIKKLIAIILVFCLTATDFIFATAGVVLALSSRAEIENGNLIFEAYFRDGDNKVTEKIANVSNGENLYISLELKAGKLQNGKIKINNANFEIVKDQINSEFVKSVNTQTDEIELKELNYNDGVIEIKIPVKFEKVEKIDLTYFERENNITLSGEYMNNENVIKFKTEDISTKLKWNEKDVKVKNNAEIEKIISLENKVIVQVKIVSEYENNYYPKEQEKIIINTQDVKGITPKCVVLEDGVKVSNVIENKKENGLLQTVFTNEFKDERTIEWNNQANIYKAIYTYEGIDKIEEPLKIQAEIETILLNKIKSNDIKELTVPENNTQGALVGISANSLTNETYKGYMYANSNETTYDEEYELEISSSDEKDIELDLTEDYFKTENGELISTNKQTKYNQIKINKGKLEKILGKAGKIIIKPIGVKEIEINSQTSADSNGNIVIDKLDGAHGIKIHILDAENEGVVKIEAQKAIKGSAKYDKETLKTINAIQTIAKVSIQNAEQTVDCVTQLKETKTSATITMNNDNILSATSENDVEFIATLKTGTMDTDLLKEPAVIITLPEEVVSTKITSVSALYAEEALKVIGQKVSEDNRKIVVKLDGEQINYNNKFIEGIKITINAKISLKEMATSRKAAINMIYTNENRSGDPFETNVDVTISAPVGLITKSALDVQFENRNKGLEKLAVTLVNNCGNTIKNVSLIGNMPEVEMTKKEFEDGINKNFKSTLEGIKIDIQYSNNGEEWNNDFENAKYFKIITNTKFNVGEGFGIGIQFETNKILDDFKFEYQIQDAKRKEKLNISKITTNYNDVKDIEEIEDNEEEKEDKTEKTVQTNEKDETKNDKIDNSEIKNENSKEQNNKENKEQQQSKNNTNTQNIKSNVKEESNTKEEQVKQIKPLIIKIVAKSGEGQVKDGDEVVEGQIIRYIYLVKNNTNNDINNVMLNTVHENANVFKDTVTKQEISSSPDEIANYTHELETTENKAKCYLGSLKPGETKRATYQIRVKENVQNVENKVTATADNIEEQKLLTYNFVKNGELKLQITNNETKENAIAAGKVFANAFTLTNTTNKDLENINIGFVIPKEFKFFNIEKFKENIEYTVVQQQDNYVTFIVNKIPAGETKKIYVSLKVTDENPEETIKKLQYFANVNGKNYFSNEVEVKLRAVKKSQIQANMSANINGNVKKGDNLIYTVSIKNMGEEATNITLTDSVPVACVIKQVYYNKDGETKEIKDITNNLFYELFKVNGYEEFDVIIETEVNTDLTPDEEVLNYAVIEDNNMSDLVKTNEIVNKLEHESIIQEELIITEASKNNIEMIEELADGEEPVDRPVSDERFDDISEVKIEKNRNIEENFNQENKDEVRTEVEQKEVRYRISGTAWTDENKNGKREKEERTIAGLKVELGNIETGNYVTDNEGNRIKCITNENGEYSFENISNGKYIVIFEYDNAKYKNAEYNATSANEETNSDIITSKLSKSNDEIKYAITDTLIINGKNLENIDAGFIENEIFDLNLNQQVSKVTIKNDDGITEKTINSKDLAKIELNNKDLEGSNVFVEYKLEVKNEGTIPGYAYEIVDYLPKDMNFNSKMNPNWYLSNDGSLHNTTLSKEIIKPGETKEVTLILAKEITKNNIGLTTNKAEIAQSSNDLAVLDKDAKSNNDVSTSDVIITSNTGTIILISAIVFVIAIITTGVVIYIKKGKE